MPHPRQTSGMPERRLPAGGLSVTRTPTRPRPATMPGRPTNTRTKQQRRAEMLDLAMEMHKRITAATYVAESSGNTRMLKKLKKADRSCSKAINLLIDLIP